MEFKEIIKDLRLERNLSQKKLAEALSLSQSCITKLESGTREPTGSTLLAYSRFFCVSIDYLVGKDESEQVATYEAKTGLSDKEKELIRVYRSLSDSGKNTLIGSAHNIERYDPQVLATKKA